MNSAALSISIGDKLPDDIIEIFLIALDIGFKITSTVEISNGKCS